VPSSASNQQPRLQLPLQGIYPSIGFPKPFMDPRGDPYTRSYRVRPTRVLAYEHMFPTANKPKLAQRALDALRVARSFLLLEDDYDVDWEVDQDEPNRVPHPHRAPLRGRVYERRAGQVAAAKHLCLSPLEPGAGSISCAGSRLDEQSQPPHARATARR
jgi:hypothetical protein